MFTARVMKIDIPTHPIKRRCSSAKFIQNYQAAMRRRVQDFTRFRHFDHKSGASSGQVIGGCGEANVRMASNTWYIHTPPILVRTESSNPSFTEVAGTYEPICAIIAMRAIILTHELFL